MRISENTNTFVVRKGVFAGYLLFASLFCQVLFWLLPFTAEPLDIIGVPMFKCINMVTWPFLLCFFYYLVTGEFHRIVGTVDFNGIRGLDVSGCRFNYQWRQIRRIEFWRVLYGSGGGNNPTIVDKDSIILNNGRTVCLFWTIYYEGLTYRDISEAVDYYSKGTVQYEMHHKRSERILKKRKPYEL